MGVVKLNISLDDNAEKALRRRSSELKKPASRYLADLILEDERKARDLLADEGYRYLANENRKFAQAVWPGVQNGWPEWEEDEPPKAEGNNG